MGSHGSSIEAAQHKSFYTPLAKKGNIRLAKLDQTIWSLSIEKLHNNLTRPSAVGSLTNPLKLANRFSSEKKIAISNNTISNYLSYFEEAYIIYAAKRYDIKGSKYFSTPLKYYFADIGLRNARLNFRQIEETHLMENIIYNDLLRRGFNVDVGVVEYSHISEGKKIRTQLEVDFVVNRGNLKYYIQSAFALPTQEKTEQERNSLKRITDSFKKIIIVRDDIVPRYDEYGIYYIGIKKFLLMEDLPQI